MVSVTIYIEGGVLPNSETAAATVNNSQQLRESFNKLFRQLLNEEEFNLKVEMGGGEKQTVKFFKNAMEKGEDAIVLLDVYAHKNKQAKLQAPDFDLSNYDSVVFFMVREMEAWILSQPRVIEEYAKKERLKRIKINSLLEDDEWIKDKKVQTIDKPSDILHTLLGRYFRTKRDKKPKYNKGGKLKMAPKMMELLQFKQLENDFDDIERLIAHIRSKNNTL